MLIEAALRLGCRRVSSIIQTKHGVVDAVTPAMGEKRLTGFVDAYVERAISFKIENGFPPDERLLPQKIAALLVDMLGRMPFDELFLLNPTLRGTAYPRVARAMVVDRVVCACLGVGVDFARSELGGDILTLLWSEDPLPSVRVLCVLFHAVYQAAGSPDHCLRD